MSIAVTTSVSPYTSAMPEDLTWTASVARREPSSPLPLQILVRVEFLHRTLIVPAPPGTSWDIPPEIRDRYVRIAIVQQLQVLHSSTEEEEQEDPFLNVLLRCSDDLLRITHWNPPFCACTWRHGALRGGKGGFGTLLKGQSRQSAAHTTKHFHDCRNLQGQRLRHVNEQLHYQLWKEWHDKVQAGTATEAELLQALTNTASGIAGWHLPLPAWAEVSVKKEQRQNRTLLRRWTQEQTQRTEEKQRQRERSEQQIASYVQTARQANERLERTIESALQEGLRKQPPAQKRPRTESVQANKDMAESEVSAMMSSPPPLALVTLSGEASISQSDASEGWTIQGHSNFCTIGILLDATQYHAAFTSQKKDDTAVASAPIILYYEVVLRSGTGIVQVGWARSGATFQPNSDTGDGVGDGASSWGYDPSRSIRLHGGASESYGILDANSTNPSSEAPNNNDLRGAVVGCGWNVRTGEIFYSLNGRSLGTAFTVGASESSLLSPLYPVMSCNEGETVQIRLDAKEMTYFPSAAVAVGELLAEEALIMDSNGSIGLSETAEEDMDQKPKAIETTSAASADPTNAPLPAPLEPVEVPEEPLDLMQCSSAQELEALGLDRLKRELVAAGLKCGGTLSERAKRLFAIRGLDPHEYPVKLRAASKGKN